MRQHSIFRSLWDLIPTNPLCKTLCFIWGHRIDYDLGRKYTRGGQHYRQDTCMSCGKQWHQPHYPDNYYVHPDLDND